MSKQKNVQSRAKNSDGRYLQAGATAMAAGLLILSAQAYAEEQADSAAKQDTLEEIVVTAMRASLKSAQDIKKNAKEVVDSITAVDIGALPDRSVIEALARIPGVQLQRTNANRDPARLSAEGGAVFIRGLSYTSNQTNGRDIFSAVNGRSLSFEDVPSELMAGVDVYKNPTADHIEGSIAGIVDLRTRKPFDSDKAIIAGSVDYNYADLLQKGFWSGSALFSDNFETGIGRIGFLAAVSHGDIGNRTDAIQLDRFDPETDNAHPGETVYLPKSYGWRRVDWEQKRDSANVVLQYQPIDRVTLTFNAFAARANPHDFENLVGDNSSGLQSYVNNPGSAYNYDGNGVVIGGTAANVNLWSDLRTGAAHHSTEDFSLNLKWQVSDQWTLTADTQHVISHADDSSWTTAIGGNFSGTLDFAGLNTDDPRMHFTSAADLKDPSNYYWQFAMDHYDDNEATEWAHRLDAEFAFNDNPWLSTLNFGARYADKEAITRQTGWNWGAINYPWNGGPALNTAGKDIPGGYEFDTFDNFFRGSINLPGGFYTPTRLLAKLGPVGAYPYFQTMGSVPWGSWQPVNTDYYASTGGAGTGVNNQDEKSTAEYMMLNFGHEKLDGNIGVRLVHTETDGTSFPGASASVSGSCVTGVQDCTTFTAAQAYATAYNAANTGRVAASSSYTNTLPTLNLRYKLTDDLQARFAAGLGIYRPTFAQLSGQGTETFNFDSNTGQLTSNPLTGNFGNPDLKPVRSRNIDASLEWYFAPSGSLTGAVFYKTLKDYIFASTIPYTVTLGTTPVTGTVTTYVNGSKGIIKGFEVGYQQFYDNLPSFLRGFGVAANYTYVENSGGVNVSQSVYDTNQNSGASSTQLPMEGLSRDTFNGELMYEAHKVSARLAYNWRSEYLLTTSAANINAPVWMERFGQLDASVFYTVTDHIKLGLQSTNLLNARTFMDVGSTDLHPRYSWTDTDRRVAFVVRATF